MNKSKKNIILIGGGGHCKSCIEVLNSIGKYNIEGILDLPKEMGKDISGIKVIGNDGDYLRFHEKGCSFLITVGQIKNAEIRKGIYDKLKSIDAKIETVIASTAYVSEEAQIAEGTIVMHQVFINAGVKIGANNILNTASLLEHDVTIGSHNHISTNAVINGDVKLGNENFIGSNAVINNGISIADNCIIGAGAVVNKSIETKGVFVGNPAKKIK